MNVVSHYDRGQKAYDQGKWPEAVFHLELARQEAPDDLLLLAQLGSALKWARQFERAEAIHQSLVHVAPHAPEAVSDLAAVYLAWGRLSEAEMQFEKAVSLGPDEPELLFNLATARQRLGKLDQAKVDYERVVLRAPGHHRAWSNLGICLKGLGEYDEARRAQEQAVALCPDNPDHQWNLALTELLLGDLDKGFGRYEWRRRIRGFPRIGGRPWRGEHLDDDVLVVHTEQGMGDTLQFIRYLPEAKSRAVGLVLMCRPSMVKLLQESFSGVDDVWATGPVSDSTPTAPLLSLPYLLGNTSPLSETVPYLRAAPERVSYWSRLLTLDGRLKVGLCWQGNPDHRDDAARSIPLSMLAPLFRNREIRFFSLQKYHGVGQLDSLSSVFDIVELGSTLDDSAAFVDTAAAMTCMDIIITVDTAIAHLAGALGLETWTLLPSTPDFRWGLGRSAYYPTMRLFRQRQRGDWRRVVDELTVALFDAAHPVRCLI